MKNSEKNLKAFAVVSNAEIHIFTSDKGYAHVSIEEHEDRVAQTSYYQSRLPYLIDVETELLKLEEESKVMLKDWSNPLDVYDYVIDAMNWLCLGQEFEFINCNSIEEAASKVKEELLSI